MVGVRVGEGASVENAISGVLRLLAVGVGITSASAAQPVPNINTANNIPSKNLLKQLICYPG